MYLCGRQHGRRCLSRRIVIPSRYKECPPNQKKRPYVTASYTYTPPSCSRGCAPVSATNRRPFFFAHLERGWVVELVPAIMGRRERSRAARRCVSLEVIYGCLAVLLALASVESMTMEVDNGEQQCVIVNIGKATTINANYEVRSVTRYPQPHPLLAEYAI